VKLGSSAHRATGTVQRLAMNSLTRAKALSHRIAQ
jgi:hypothetical protein